MSSHSVLAPAAALQQFIAAILVAAGSHESEAGEIAEHMVESNLAGHDSHGVGMLPTYMQHLADGQVHPNKLPVRLGGGDPFAIFDGQMGYGQPVTNRVMDEAAWIARRCGVAVVTLRNVQHIGRLGAYGERLSRQGLLSIHFVNAVYANACVAPHGGCDARLMTNPICVAVPGRIPVLLDFATSGIAMGKTRVAYNKGVPVAPGRLIDHRGKPTTDPAVMWEDPRGALLPLGEHKGWGLAFVAELLGGVLAGGPTSGDAPGQPRGLVNGMFSIVLEPGRLVDVAQFDDAVVRLVEYVKASPAADPQSPVMVPGEPERRMKATRAGTGIPIDAATWSQLAGCAHARGVSVPVFPAA
jgi:uncharacterized oxidoreductase